ncbi:MAG: GNAT family N-acetyltransferase [Desulfocucumaceae bacterium]
MKIFDQFLGQMFPRFSNILAEIWDREATISVLTDLLNCGAVICATFPLGKFTRKADQIIFREPCLDLVDDKKKTAYRVGQPLKMEMARFSTHPMHNFVRMYYDGTDNSRGKTNWALLKEHVDIDADSKVKFVGSPGWLVFYPGGSLLSDQRLENRVRDLAVEGRESSLFNEFMTVNEGELSSAANIALIDYVPDDARLWEQWFGKMDTNMFQTIVRPSKFSSTSGRSDDYYLKIIKYGNKKVGAAWLEKINLRNGTAELGLLIGEPHLWGMGIGSKVMRAVTEMAKNDLGLKFLWVSVRESNQRAVNCYKKGGFLIVRKTPVFNKADGSYQIWVQMEKMI